MRVLQAQQAKPQEEPPIPLSTARQDEQLAAEQEAGRRALARYAQRNKPAAAQIDAGEKTTEGLPEFKITQENPNRTPQQQTLFEAEIAAGRNALQNAKPNEVSQNPPTQSTLNPRKIP
jgi:hypothetical protein